jgi:hypothetical protein
MLNSEDESIVTDCTTCHTVLAQNESTVGTLDEPERGQQFLHPEDGSAFEEFTLCSDCHTGGKELYE